MTLTTDIFLIGLLPWFVIAYWFLGAKSIPARYILLALANSIFIMWGNPASFLSLVVYSLVIRCFAALIFYIKSKWILGICLLVSSLPLIFFKYTGFLLNIINEIVHGNIRLPDFFVPLGISFVTFEAISLLVDLYRGKINKSPNCIETYLYLSFLPTVSSGPITRFDVFKSGLSNPSFSDNMTSAVERIVIGMCKKILIADKISIIADYYFDGISAGMEFSSPGLWIGSVAYTLQLYYDFSGYTDMAVGIGRLLGFELKENFDRPYQASSVSMFWKRWHISLTEWFRDYIYIPLGGNRCSSFRHICNMLIVWMITGLWHGADGSFLLWGIGYCILLIIEKYIPVIKKITSGLPGHIYTLFFVNILWVPFRSDSVETACKYVVGMFGGGSGLLESKAIRFIPIMTVAVLLCFPWNKILSDFREQKWFKILKGMVIIVLAFLAICGMVNLSYSPYIYGNF